MKRKDEELFFLKKIIYNKSIWLPYIFCPSSATDEVVTKANKGLRNKLKVSEVKKKQAQKQQ